MANGSDGGVRTRERESEGEEGKNRGRVRESRGRAWRRSRPSRRGGEGQAGRRAGGVARWRARAPATLPSLCRDEDDRGGRWAGPAAGWAAQWRSPGKLLLLFISVFLISDICFDLNNILNHLFNLCQFLQELFILFQSSFIIGIIFGHILIYIINIFPMQIFRH